MIANRTRISARDQARSARCSICRKPQDLIPVRLAPDPDFNLIAVAELAEQLGRLSILGRELDKLHHAGG
jgi:hypothetical protein